MKQNFLNKAINNYRNYLNSSFNTVKIAYNSSNHETLSFDDFFHDWAQAAWELLVERIVCNTHESLVIYGSGSDYEQAKHSRVFFHSLEPTHEIICYSNKEVIDSITNEFINISSYEFDGFVAFNMEWFEINKPFDHVLLSEKVSSRLVVVPIENVEFKMQVMEM